MITIGADTAGNGPVPPVSQATLTRFLNRARAAVGLRGNVDVLLTSDAELKRLNRTFRGKNKSTDVLSFPADAIPGLPEIHQHAGDLAISLETAARQAASFSHPLETELRILLLHGLLHLAGLDHETDTGEMANRESELRTKLRLPTSLIARTLGPAVTQKAVMPTQVKRSRGTRVSPQTARASKDSRGAKRTQRGQR